MKQCFLWAGRHELIPAEVEFILRHLGNPVIIRKERIWNHEHLLEIIGELRRRGCGRIVVAGTMPLSVFMRIAPLQETHGFEVWWPDMNELARNVSISEAHALVEQDKERRVMVCDKRQGCRVYEFVGFKRLREVRLVLEPID